MKVKDGDTVIVDGIEGAVIVNPTPSEIQKYKHEQVRYQEFSRSLKKYKELLTPDTLKAGNAANGRAIFAKNCATCHKLFGEGQAVGPELTGAQRSNLDYILDNVVDPSAAVANEYKMHQFDLLDGRVVTGIVKKESPQAVTVRTVNEELVLPVKDIETRKPTQNSVMPEGMFDALKPEEVRDLVAYLMGKGQVPLPK